MNRTIKFRVYNKNSRKWGHPAPEFILGIDGCCIYLEDSDGGYAIQQSTGLKDKNGREIFEGDIVKHSNEDPTVYKLPAEVSIGEYSTHCGEFKHFGVRAKRLDISTYFGLFEDCEKFEVIGNIFDNPELLK